MSLYVDASGSIWKYDSGSTTADNSTDGSWFVVSNQPQINIGDEYGTPCAPIQIQDCNFQQEDETVRKLYEVFVVDSEAEVIVARKMVVAKTEAKAQMKVAQGLDQDIDDLVFFVDQIGALPEKKGVQEVKIVE